MMTWRQKLRKIILILLPILYTLCLANVIYEAFVVINPDAIDRFLSVSIAINRANFPCIIAFALISALNANANIKISLHSKEWRELLYIGIAWGILPVFERISAHLIL